MARLLAMDPDVWLMDEPFSSLDEQTRKKLDSDILNIWRIKEDDSLRDLTWTRRCIWPPG